jgi:hypothetical protein
MKGILYNMATEIDKLPYNTELQARDIPRETIDHAIDSQIKPTYVPDSPPKYIENVPVDKWEEFRLPALLSILYFLWNVPSVQLMVEKTFPSIFADATTGLFAKSVCFGLLYYGITIGAVYLGKP